MKGSVKLFIASLMVLAAAIGFFAGSTFGNKCPFKGDAPCERMMPPPPGFDGKTPPPNFDGKTPPPPPGMHKGPHGPGMKGPHGKFGKGPSPEMMDSLLQVTPEQKASLEKQRNKMDTSFKALREQKMEAEKALRTALDNGDDKKIAEAKKNILTAQEKMLDARITGSKELSTILSKDQLTKLHDFQKDMFKKHHKGLKGGPHEGPRGEFKPGQMPPPPPQD